MTLIGEITIWIIQIFFLLLLGWMLIAFAKKIGIKKEKNLIYILGIWTAYWLAYVLGRYLDYDLALSPLQSFFIFGITLLIFKCSEMRNDGNKNK